MTQPLVVVAGGAALGVILASYLNTVALRWGQETSHRLGDRSRCPACGTPLGWAQLIPVVSYLIQRGRCRSCQALISPRYPLIELGFAGLTAGLLATYGLTVQAGLLVIVASVCLLLVLIDLDQQLLPDQLTLPLLGFMAASLAVLDWTNLLEPLAGSAWQHWTVGGLVGGGVPLALTAITRGQGMGLGDSKLGAALGVSVGGISAGLILGISFLAGGVIGAILLLTKRATRKTAVPFGPFLVLGWLVVVFWHEPILGIVSWYTGF